MAIVEGRRKERRELVMMVCSATGPLRNVNWTAFGCSLSTSAWQRLGAAGRLRRAPAQPCSSRGQVDPLLSASIIIHRHDIELHAAPLGTSAITASPHSIKMKDESKSSDFYTSFLCSLTSFADAGPCRREAQGIRRAVVACRIQAREARQLARTRDPETCESPGDSLSGKGESRPAPLDYIPARKRAS